MQGGKKLAGNKASSGGRGGKKGRWKRSDQAKSKKETQGSRGQTSRNSTSEEKPVVQALKPGRSRQATQNKLRGGGWWKNTATLGNSPQKEKRDPF